MTSNDNNSPGSDLIEDDSKVFDFTFTGTGKEYFKIWIVNLCLTIVTLGLYSPWATVRSKRYLLGNTWLAKNNFDFHGDPKAMLKGRIIAMALLALYLFGDYIHFYIPMIVLVIGALLLPWFMLSSYRFRLMNTSYRHIRFQFSSTLTKAYLMYWPLFAIVFSILIPVLLLSELITYLMVTEDAVAINQFMSTYMPLFSLILLVSLICYPWFVKNRSLFMVNNALFGHHSFHTKISYGSVIKLYLLCLLVILLVLVIGSLASGFFAIIVFKVTIHPIITAVLGYMIFLPVFLYLISFWRAGLMNLIFKNASLDKDKLTVNWDSLSYWTVLVTNFFITILTLGFAYPWAVINIARYKASTIKIHSDNLDKYTGKSTHNDKALGDEMSSAFDLDFGI